MPLLSAIIKPVPSAGHSDVVQAIEALTLWGRLDIVAVNIQEHQMEVSPFLVGA